METLKPNLFKNVDELAIYLLLAARKAEAHGGLVHVRFRDVVIMLQRYPHPISRSFDLLVRPKPVGLEEPPVSLASTWGEHNSLERYSRFSLPNADLHAELAAKLRKDIAWAFKYARGYRSEQRNRRRHELQKP